MPRELARYRWKKAIKQTIKNLKWLNIRDAIRFEKAYGNHGPYWRRIPVKDLSNYGKYRGQKIKRHTDRPYKWHYINGQWILKR